MKPLLFIVLALAFVVIAIYDPTPDANTATAQTDPPRYPGPWQDAIRADLIKTLAHNNVHGCGQFEYKLARHSQTEYKVRCGDGQNWRYYLAFTAIDKVNRATE